MTTGRINQVAIGRIGIRRLPRAQSPGTYIHQTELHSTYNGHRPGRKVDGERLTLSRARRRRENAEAPLIQRTFTTRGPTRHCGGGLHRTTKLVKPVYTSDTVSRDPKALGAAYRTPGDVTAGQPHICQETRSRTVIASYNHCRHL